MRRASPVRDVVESFVLLALAVLLFRTFAAEGYLISTGSMAPTLLGYHRCVECPACHYSFTRGAAFDKPDSTMSIASADLEGALDAYSATQCPNCSYGEINARIAPRNEGDQLLVQKLAYEFRDPRRWEVVVFKNQKDQKQAYVKRVVGLPGENLRLQDGDIYANNQLMRKPYPVQRATRIIVSDYLHQPEDGDPDWRPRWITGQPSNGWTLNESSLEFEESQGSHQPELKWLKYENWVRTGGEHLTRVPLKAWPADVQIPNDPRFRYENQELIYIGTFSAFEKQKRLQKSDDPEYQAALEQLYHESHIAPIVDTYGYNYYENRKHALQHDLMLSVLIEHLSGRGQFEIHLTDGSDWFRLVLLPASHEIAIFHNQDPTPIWGGRLDSQLFTKSFELDFSLFDQQVCVAINGTAILAPIPFSPSQKRSELRRPVRIGAVDVKCRLSDLKLYRDVHYTQKGDDPDQTFELQNDEFFVLGDNSPVSLDSRVWEKPAVPRKALIGKPFVVHLPSRQKKIEWNGEVENVRVPDFSKIRYIR